MRTLFAIVTALTLAGTAPAQNKESAVNRRARIELAVTKVPQSRALCEAFKDDACDAIRACDKDTGRKLALAYPEILERFPKPAVLLRTIARSEYPTPVAQYALNNAERLRDPACFEAFTQGDTMELVLDLKTLDAAAAEVRARRLEPPPTQLTGIDNRTLVMCGCALLVAFLLGWAARAWKKP